MKILIVEDNAAVRRLIASVLAPLASTITECTDGGDALIAYEAYRPDVVLMDIAMQRLDGLAATPRRRRPSDGPGRDRHQSCRRGPCAMRRRVPERAATC